MAFSQKERFVLLPQLVSEMSKPMSHPARVKIMMHLLEHGETVFYELVRILPLHSSTVSQHLRLLRRSRLVDVRERAPHTYYELNKEQFRKHILVMREFLRMLFEKGIDPRDLTVSLEDDLEDGLEEVGEDEGLE